MVHDPKPRNIHKACVTDRVLHHAIHRILEPVFDQKFIFDSYACRTGKGSRQAVARFRSFAWKVSRNNTRTVWVLKCDIRRFFDSVDRRILFGLLAREVSDAKALQLLWNVTRSFEKSPGKGIPLGNLTSQLFANVYLDRLDQFIKRRLGVKHYIRYADDFTAVSHDKAYLEKLIPKISGFLKRCLALELHAGKLRIMKWHQGVDFLGYVSFPHHAVLRTKTKRRLLARVKTDNSSSYVGLLIRCRGYEIARHIHIDQSPGKSYNTAI
jgi:retron-type reverse transcriptase